MSKNKVYTIDADKFLKDEANNPDGLFQKDVEIKSATLKDALCNYSYELMTGATIGDTIGRKGNHIVHEHLEVAFSKLNVFLAHLDDAFTGNDNATTLETLENEIETESYSVCAFKITGVEENKSLIICGSKYVTAGVISFETPKIKLNGNYLYLSDLTTRLESVVDEVEAYMNGKTAPQAEQIHMDFASEDAAFENAKFDEEAV